MKGEYINSMALEDLSQGKWNLMSQTLQMRIF